MCWHGHLVVRALSLVPLISPLACLSPTNVEWLDVGMVPLRPAAVG